MVSGGWCNRGRRIGSGESGRRKFGIRGAECGMVRWADTWDGSVVDVVGVKSLGDSGGEAFCGVRVVPS